MNARRRTLSLLASGLALNCAWACAGAGDANRGVGGAASQASGDSAGRSSLAGAPASGGLGASGAFPAQGGAIGSGGQSTGPSDNGGAISSGGTSAGGASSGGASSGAGGASAPRPPVVAASGAKLVKVNPALRQQKFEGFGTSLCWWANNVGGWAADKRNALVDLVADPIAGLGYNVFRYNIGGGENPAHTHMDKFRDMPGFESADGTFDWNADANQRAVLLRLAERVPAPIFEAFSNSPPYWMTSSGCASGNSDGSNNLKSGSYDAFADYLVQVVKHYHDAFGITFRTLEPLNEPNASWWKESGGQEGCHFNPTNQQTIIKAVSSALQTNGVSGTQVSASDENSMDDAYNNLRGFDAKTNDALGQFNVHSYAGSKRAELRTLATSKGKRLWQSESGPLSVDLASDIDAALFMAGRIITDLKDLQPEAWIDWQVADPARNWASFAVNNSQQSFTLLKRFYMHAGFSRYIRPGATFIRIDTADMVAAEAADGSQLTLVVRNDDAASKSFTFDLTAVASVGSEVAVHRTSASENLAQLSAIPIMGYAFTATMPAHSVTTLVIPAH
ncbi:MAG TPA: glycoside hydrolase [Polyangiaceae bacterium]|nr:glycoside hydrolase [Polyangiaceae bacterium]